MIMNRFKPFLILITLVILSSCEDNKEDKQKNEVIEEEEKFNIPCLPSNGNCRKIIQLTGAQNYTFDIFV